jgi:hypothetical protein
VKQWIAILAIAGVLIGEAAAQNTRRLVLDVQVIDPGTGEIPELLGSKDFEIYDDGKRIPIHHLAIDTPPMDFVFVVYLSNSGLSTREDRKRYTKGLNAAVISLRQDDRAAVVRGAGPHGRLLGLTSDANAIRQALLRGPRAQHEIVLALAPAGLRVHAGAPRFPAVHLPRLNGIIGGGNPSGASLVNVVRATGGEHQIGDHFDSAFPALTVAVPRQTRDFSQS